jgi:hypothetical protein
MTALAPNLATTIPPITGKRPLPDPWNLLVWLIASAVAVYFALIVKDSSVLDGNWLPRGNDSFYHARRILDAAIGSRGFYQFDDHLQVPEGAWISWPWGYDYLMAKSTQVALWISPTLDPMGFISYVPVAWIFVNAALFLAAATAIGLSRDMRVLAMFCFALSPLTQLLHAIGMVDHHYIEHTFVLLNAWLGVLWFREPADSRRAVALGVSLGLAMAFHNGLFILQLVPLAAIFALWLRKAAPPPRALRSFAAALLITTQLILLPSEPYRSGMFEFGLLSWFHFYIAICTATALGFMAWRQFTPGNFAALAALCLVLAIPLGAQVGMGAGFLSGEFSILDQIIEVRSPFRMFTDTLGPTETASYYSWLLLLAPALLVFYGYRTFRETRSERLYYAIVVVFGLALMLDQFRLHVFGFFGFVTGGLLIVDQLRARLGWHHGGTFVVCFAVIVLAYQPALRERLFVVYAPGADPEYASAYSIFLELESLCRDEPGVVLASPDDGSPILFHSECKVIANNYILRQEDKAHLDEIARLMSLSPGQIRAERPDIKYVFVRAKDFSLIVGETEQLVAASPIASQLFIEQTPPPGYSLIRTVWRSADMEGPSNIYARLFEVLPTNATGP